MIEEPLNYGHFAVFLTVFSKKASMDKNAVDTFAFQTADKIAIGGFAFFMCTVH